MFKFNPRSCSSASWFSGCVHRNKSKCCIALLTDADFVRLFEKTLIGGFSCVKTRLAYDTNILLKDTDKEKVLIEIHINGKKQWKRLSSKILKMDENNQTINMAWRWQSHFHMDVLKNKIRCWRWQNLAKY